MARQYKTGIIITGDASGGIKAVRAADDELQRLNKSFNKSGQDAKRYGRDLNGGISEGLKNLDNRMASLESSSQAAQHSLSTLRTVALSAAGAVAGIFAADRMAGQARLISDTLAMSDALDMSVTKMMEWQYAASQQGMNAEKVGDIFKDVSDKLGDFANNEGGEAADLIENLGLNIEDLIALSPDQAILKIAAAIEQLPTAQQVNYWESLGDDMVRLRPLLADGAAGLREASLEAGALNIAMSQIDAENAAQAMEAMTRLKGVADGLSNALIADLGPGIAENVSALTDFISEAGGASQIIDTLIDSATVLAVLLGGRMVGALAQVTNAAITAVLASGREAVAAREVRLEREAEAAQSARLASAEQTRAANSARLSAQRIENARLEAVAERERVLQIQQSLAAERALEAQRLQAQISARGRAESLNRLAELRRQELVVSGQVTAANRAVAASETQATLARRALRTATVEKTLADNVATAAVARYTAATVTSTVATRAMAISARIAGGAMALVGGWIGVIAIAGYGIYTLASNMETAADRAEKLSQRSAELTERVKALRGETDGLTESQRKARIEMLEQRRAELVEKSNVDRLIEKRKELFELQRKLRDQGHNETADQIQHTIDNLNREIANTAGLSGAIADIDEQLSNLKRGHEDLNESVAATDSAYKTWLENTKDKLDPMREVERQMSNVWRAFDAGDLNGEEVNQIIEWITEDLLKNSDASKEASLSYSEWLQQLELTNEVGPATAKRIRDIKARLHELYEAAQKSGKSTGEFSQEARKLKKELDELQPKTRQASSAIDEFTRRTKERLDDIGGDFFRGMWDGGLDSFDDFRESLEKGFKDTMAEISYMWFKSAIFSDQSQGGLGLGNIMNFTQGGASGGGVSGNGVTGGLGGLAGLGETYNYFFGAKEAAATSGGLGASGGMTSTAASTVGWAMLGSYLASTAIDTVAENSGAYEKLGVDTDRLLPQIGGLISPYFKLQGGWIDSALQWVGFDIDKTLGLGSGRKPKFGFKNIAEDPSLTGANLGHDTDGGDEPWYSSGGFDDGSLGRGRTTAFGSFGFTYKEMFEPEDMVKVLDSLEQMDNAISSMLDPDQIESVKRELDGFDYNGKNMKGVVAARLAGIIESIDSDYVESVFDINSGLSGRIYEGDINDSFTRLVSGLAIENVAGEMGNVVAEQMFEGFQEAVNSDITNKGLKQLADQFTTIGNTILTLDAASEQLGFTFDVNTEKTYDIAESINQAMGGLENLQAAQTAYYQNYFSEEERKADTFEQLKNSLTEYFDAVDIAMPQTKAAFRALVESLDATTESGSEAYVALMQIQGQAAQYYQMLAEQQAQATQNALASFELPDDMLNYLQDLSDWASQELTQISQTYAERIRLLEQEQRVGRELRQYVEELKISELSPAGPAEKLAEASSQFAALLVKAENGDMDAAGRLRGSAQAYLENADSYYGRTSAYTSVFEDVINSLDGLGIDLMQSDTTAEKLNAEMLREQQRIRDYVRSELDWAQRQFTQLASITQLLEQLPNGLSSSLSDIINSQSGGQSGRPSTPSRPTRPTTPSEPSMTDATWADQQVRAIAAGMVSEPELKRVISNFQAALADGASREAVYNNMLSALIDSTNYDSEWQIVYDYYMAKGVDSVPGMINGSHRNGLESVPFDGYVAELHQREMILPAPVADHIRGSMGKSPMDLAPLLQRVASLEEILIAILDQSGDNATALSRRLDDIKKTSADTARHTRPSPVTIG